MEINEESVNNILADEGGRNLVVKGLTADGSKIISKDDYEKFLQTTRDEVHSDITREIYSNFDKDITEITGLSKNSEEKTYDFNKRAFRHLLEGKKSLEEKVGNLEEKVKAGEGNEVLADQLAGYKSKANEFEQQVTQLKTELSNKDIRIDIESGLKGLKFNPNIPETVRNSFIQEVRSKLLKTGRIHEGKAVFNDENGKTALNDKLEPASAEFLLNKMLEPVLEKPAVQGGSGGNSPQGPELKVEEDKVIGELPESIKTDEEAIAYVREEMVKKKGYTTDSKEVRTAAKWALEQVNNRKSA